MMPCVCGERLSHGLAMVKAKEDTDSLAAPGIALLLEGMQHSINTHKAYMRKKETEKDGKKETDSEDKSKRSEGKQNEISDK
jgi:hypothetical protein